MINFLLTKELIEQTTNQVTNQPSSLTPSDISLIISAIAVVISAIISLISIIYNSKATNKNTNSHNYIETVTKPRNDWLLRIKTNSSSFLSMALSEENGNTKYQKLITLKLIIVSDLNTLESEDELNITYVCPENNKIFFRQDTLNTNKVDKGLPLEVVIVKEMDMIIECSKAINPSERILDRIRLGIKKLTLLFNLFFTSEWENIKKDNYKNKGKTRLKLYTILNNFNAKWEELLPKEDDDNS